MALSDWRPTIEQVAVYLRARTYIDGTISTDAGSEAGTFTAETRPTATQVEAAIDEAVEEVTAPFTSADVPSAAYRAATRAATLITAATVELSYFPEQSDESASTYTQLRALADGAVADLQALANLIAMSAESST